MGPDGPEDFETGVQTGQEIELDRVADLLEDEGFDPDDIDEMLYDPAPRKRKGHRGRKKTRRAYDPSPRRRYGRRRYDPAPRKSYRKRAKGALGKLRKWVMPGAAALTFYGAYQKRAHQLKKSVWDAIQQDIRQFDADKAMERVAKKAPGIIGLGIGGAVAKHFLPGKTKLIGDAVIGVAVGMFAKTILDPPYEKGGGPGQDIPSLTPLPEARQDFGRVIHMSNPYEGRY